MSVLEETKFLMKKYKIKANKNLGQNFLIDDLAINDIVDGANILENDLVIEIGPGLGSMTSILLEKAKKVICVELDKKMIKILNDRFIAYSNIELINEDILKLDLNSIIKEEKEQGKKKIETSKQQKEQAAIYISESRTNNGVNKYVPFPPRCLLWNKHPVYSVFEEHSLIDLEADDLFAVFL